jgi:hypothetical protein
MLAEKYRERFEAKVMPEPTTGCHLWIGATTPAGYGALNLNRDGVKYAHRISFELHHGPIPPGMDICHRCDTPACVNPEHLFAGTRLDNVRDMHAKGRQAIPPRPSHCVNGHALTPDNIHLRKDGRRNCRTCDNDRCREYQRRRRAERQR